MLQLSVGGGWEGREVGIGATNYGVCFFFNERGKSFVCSFSSSHTFVPNRRRLLSFSVDLYAIGEREDWEKLITTYGVTFVQQNGKGKI